MRCTTSRRSKQAKLTNYGQFLEMYPPGSLGGNRRKHFVELRRTAWNAGNRIAAAIPAGIREWNQEWRAPLREALDWLRDTLAPRFEQQARGAR